MEKTVSNETCRFSIYDAHDYKRIDTLGHERHILASVLEEIEESDVFLDVGANIGLYSCFVGSRIITGNVIAVEAESTNATRLRDNLQRNLDNWSVICCALGDEDGTVSFELNDSAGVHRISDRGNHTIKQRRLDSLINAGEFPVPDVVKIDVEGAELMVLNGAGDYLSEMKIIYCEVHDCPIDGTVEEVQSMLENAGFKLEEIETSRGETFFKAINNRY